MLKRDDRRRPGNGQGDRRGDHQPPQLRETEMTNSHLSLSRRNFVTTAAGSEIGRYKNLIPRNTPNTNSG